MFTIHSPRGVGLTALNGGELGGEGSSNGGITQFHHLDLVLFKLPQDLADPLLSREQTATVTAPSYSRGAAVCWGRTFWAASCSSRWAITLCRAALELSLPPALAGGAGLKSAAEESFSLLRFFFSGRRSGALAKSATPGEKRENHQLQVGGVKEGVTEEVTAIAHRYGRV